MLSADSLSNSLEPDKARQNVRYDLDPNFLTLMVILKEYYAPREEFCNTFDLHVEHSAILLIFIKLPFVIKIIVLSIFEWPLYTGFTVQSLLANCLLIMLNPDICCFENSVDPDQLASQKPADQDQHCFPLCLYKRCK